MNEPSQQKSAAERRWNGCSKCGGLYTMKDRDGKDVGGLPGVTYRECTNCGHCVAKTTKPKKRYNPLA